MKKLPEGARFLGTLEAVDALDVPANESHIHESDSMHAYRFGEIYIGSHEIMPASDDSLFDGIVPVNGIIKYGIIALDLYADEIALFSIT